MMIRSGFRMAALSIALAAFWCAARTTPFFALALSSPPLALASSVPGLAPVPMREGVIVISLLNPSRRDQPARLFTPDGKELGRFAMGAAAEPLNPGGPPVCGLFHARLSPDAKRLAAFKVGPIRPENPSPWVVIHLWVFDEESKKGPTEALRPNIKHPSLAWSPDGSKLFVSEVDPEKATNPIQKGELAAMVSWVYDFKTKTKTDLKLPAGHEIADVSFDGKSLLTHVRPGQFSGEVTGHIVALDTLQSRPLTGKPYVAMRISPDGKQVIGYRPALMSNRPSAGVLVIASLADGKETTVALPPTAINVCHACWSPDGRRIAYDWTEVGAAEPVPVDNQPPLPQGTSRTIYLISRVTVADFDGSRSKTIFQSEQGQMIESIDWR